MATITGFTKTGIKGQTFREIAEKFGKPLRELGESDAVMSLYAVGFAWFRETEHLPLPEAYAKAMDCNLESIEGLFDPEPKNAKAKAEADFVKPPSTTTP